MRTQLNLVQPSEQLQRMSLPACKKIRYDKMLHRSNESSVRIA